MKNKERKRKVLKMFFNNMRILFIPLSFFMLIVSIISYFAIDNDLLKYIISGGVVVIVLIVAFIVQAIRFRRSLKQSRDGKAAQIFLHEYERMKDNRDNYSRIIEMGPIITRNLYLASSYRERIKIAEIILNAAKESRDIDSARKNEYQLVIARTQINDLGWTIVLNGDREQGKKYIEDGLNTLQELEQWIGDQNLLYPQQEVIQLKAKAKRYLGSICTVMREYEDAQNIFDEVETLCREIKDEYRRKRFLAGLHFAEAELYFMHEYRREGIWADSSYDKAIELCELAHDERLRLPTTDDRHTRYWAQFGKICYFAYKQKTFVKNGLDDLDEIRQCFEDGLKYAKETTRIDEIKKNTYGLACCDMLQGHRRRAEKVIKTFTNQYGDIDLFDTDDILVDEYNRLKEKT